MPPRTPPRIPVPTVGRAPLPRFGPSITPPPIPPGAPPRARAADGDIRARSRSRGSTERVERSSVFELEVPLFELLLPLERLERELGGWIELEKSCDEEE